MKKINKFEILFVVFSSLQVLSLFTLSTSWGKAIALISIILSPILAFYSYKKNNMSKQRFVLSLILSLVLLISLVLQLLSVYCPEIDFRLIRIVRRIGILVMCIYVWLTNEH